MKYECEDVGERLELELSKCVCVCVFQCVLIIALRSLHSFV